MCGAVPWLWPTAPRGPSRFFACAGPPPSSHLNPLSLLLFQVVGPDGTPALIPIPDTVYLDPDGTTLTEASEGGAAAPPPPPNPGRTSLPSVVAFLPGGRRAVGGAARRRAAADPARTVQSAKRLMGRSLADVTTGPAATGDTRRSRKAAGLAAFTRLESAVPGDPASPAVLALPGAGEDGSDGAEARLLPETVAADVLRALLAAAAAADAPLHRTPTRAVVSVPAHFSAAARAATLAAARAAGLTTVRLVREPVAAAIGYGAASPVDQTVLVLDLGGGTFDVALLEVGGRSRTVEVLAAGGDPALGGDDWDAAIVGWLGAEHLAPAGVADWASRPGLLASLRSLAEAAKVALSAEDAVRLTLPVGSPPFPVALLTRTKLDELSGPLYSRAAAAVDEACFQVSLKSGCFFFFSFSFLPRMMRLSAAVRKVFRTFSTTPAQRAFGWGITGFLPDGEAPHPNVILALTRRKRKREKEGESTPRAPGKRESAHATPRTPLPPHRPASSWAPP